MSDDGRESAIHRRMVRAWARVPLCQATTGCIRRSSSVRVCESEREGMTGVCGDAGRRLPIAQSKRSVNSMFPDC